MTGIQSLVPLVRFTGSSRGGGDGDIHAGGKEEKEKKEEKEEKEEKEK